MKRWPFFFSLEKQKLPNVNVYFKTIKHDFLKKISLNRIQLHHAKFFIFFHNRMNFHQSNMFGTEPCQY